jgi:hypothetical protein
MDLVMLGLILAVALLMILRVCNLIFEYDDFRFLWWAFHRGSEPWLAFTDPPLFANYYRPIVSLLWWVHYQLFGLNYTLHHLAFALWWLAIVLLTYTWNRREGNALAGLLSAMVLLSSFSFHELVIWKSWLTSVSSLVFHLLTLLCLWHYLKKPHWLTLLGMVILFLTASLCKESARFCLLFTTNAVIFSCPGGTRLRKGLLSALCAVLWLGLLLSSSPLKGYAFSHAQHFFEFQRTFQNLGHFAFYIYGNPFNQILSGLAITILLWPGANRPWWPLLLSLGAAAGVGGWAVALHIHWPHAVALAGIVYLHGAILSPKVRPFVFPLVWLIVSFWPLALLPLLTIAYGADAAIAFALLLGLVILHAWQRIQFVFQDKEIRILKPLTLAATPLLIIGLLIPSVYLGLVNVFGWARYHEIVYHNQTVNVINSIHQDLTGIRSWGDLYIDDRDHLGLETYLMILYSSGAYGFNVIRHAPERPDCYRLEAHTGANYHVDPEEDPLNLWLPERVNPDPSPTALRDPYALPERWDQTTLGTCDTLTGWQGEGTPWLSAYPNGQGQAYVNYPLTWQAEPIVLTYTSTTPSAWLAQDPNFALTFWLQSQRWSMIESAAVTLYTEGQAYRWNPAEMKTVNTWNQWKRVCLDGLNAERIENSTPTETVRVEIKIQTKAYQDVVGTYLSIDEIRLAKLKPEWRAP